MTTPTQPPAVDPDHVPETLCCGLFNLSFVAGNFATLLFTHPRPQVGPLIGSNHIQDELVVRARIVMNIDNLVALRNFLNVAIKDDPTAGHPAPTTGGSSRLN